MPGRIPGDVDGDGEVTEKDALYVARHTIFGGDNYPLDATIADMDNDGVVTMEDARLISEMAANPPTQTAEATPARMAAATFVVAGVVVYTIVKMIWR